MPRPCDPWTPRRAAGPRQLRWLTGVAGAGLVWLLAACNGSNGTGPSETVVIGDLQARTLQRPVADRPFNLEISVAASDPKRLVGGQADLRRLGTAQDTCQAPGASPVIATAPVEATNVVGNRVQVSFQGLRLPAGRSRLCFFLTLPGGLAEQPRGRQASETLLAQTNELDLVLDTVGGGSSPTPASSSPPPPRSLPVVTITAPDASAAESPLDTGTFQVTRTGSTATALTVSFTVGGTAVSGTDYTAIGASVTIPAGSASVNITVTPINDPDVESSETVVATLSSNAAYSIGGTGTATVSIASEDVAPAVTILFLAPDGSTYPCGSSVVNNGPMDWNQTNSSFVVRLTGSANFPGAMGFRFQKDLNSSTFVQETTIGSVELSGTDVRESSISPGQSPVTYRVFVHTGHTGPHPTNPSIPIAGDVVSNECTLNVTFP